jgi:Mg/Co/Ni transporter MgtE
MSARAAWRLESLGFRRVYRYTAGKMDWLANGMPCEGRLAVETYRPVEIARKDVPTCRLDEHIGEVVDRARAAGWDACVVLNEERIVLGLLSGEAFHADRTASVEQVMACSPRTYRMNASLERIAGYFQKHGAAGVLVTTTGGRLIGMIRPEDI